VREGRHAVLSTLAEDGTPFGSLVAYAFDDELRPYLFVSRLAEHTKNLVRDARASLLVQNTHEGDPLAGARATLIGTFEKAPEAAREALVERFVARHPEAAIYATFPDFSVYRLSVRAVRVIEGFGVMGFVPGEAYTQGP
jgi:hypothetical protein